MSKTNLQGYPRIEDEKSPFHGFLDDTQLQQHVKKISKKKLKKIIQEGIIFADAKSKRTILEISEDMSNHEKDKVYQKIGKDLFKYFIKYYGDPAATAYACCGKHYSVVATENFRNRKLQNERMNSGWRYQFIAKECAQISKRFLSVSDIGTAEADFNVEIQLKGKSNQKVSIYVSVKNRINTLGGQDWPKAIAALETVAKTDKNRNCPYICVFGIVMDKGKRIIKRRQKDNVPHSFNTEVWPSDFFWPFFINYSYDELIKIVLDVLIDIGDKDEMDLIIPNEIIETFGNECRKYKLLDDNGLFNNPHLLASLFVKSGR